MELEKSRGRAGFSYYSSVASPSSGLGGAISREDLDGHAPRRESGDVVALVGGVGVVQPNVGLKRTGVIIPTS